MKSLFTSFIVIYFSCFASFSQNITDNIYDGFNGTGINPLDAVTTKNGDIVLLFSNGSISRRKVSDKSWVTYNTDLSITNWKRGVICYDSIENAVWAVSSSRCVRIDLDNDTFAIIDTTTNEFFPKTVDYITYANGGIWFVSQESLVFFKNGNWQTFPTVYTNFNKQEINALAGNGDDLFWIGTVKGLFEYKNGIFNKHYTDSNSNLPFSNIQDIVFANGYLWISSLELDPRGNGFNSISLLKNGIFSQYTGNTPGLSKGFFYYTNVAGVKLHNINNVIYMHALWRDVKLDTYVEWSKLEQGKNWQYVHLKPSIGIKMILPLLDRELYYIIIRNEGGSPIISTSNTFILPNLAEQKGTLDINHVDMPLYSNGALFTYNYNKTRYGTNLLKIPKHNYLQTIFASGVWQSGLVSDSLAVAHQTYGQDNNYESGPVNLKTRQRDEMLIQKYNKVWKVDRSEILLFKENYDNGNVTNGTFTVPESIVNWPAMGDTSKGEPLYIAPFVDVNGDGIYNPINGDFPKIKGDMALFVVFNDLKTRLTSNNNHLQTEIHMLAYAYTCNRLMPSQLQDAMNYAVFFDYTIINRNNQPIDDYRFAIWTDFEIGNHSNDYHGCNPKENFMFAYNGSEIDPGPSGYNENPPALANAFISPLKIKSNNITSSMTNFMLYNNDYGPTGNPINEIHYSNYMHSKWRNGDYLWYQNRLNDTALHIYPFSDDLKGRSDWSLESSTSVLPNDRKLVMTTGGHRLLSNDTATTTVALVYARAESGGRLASLDKLRQSVRVIQEMYDTDSFPSCYDLMIGLKENNQAFKPKLTVYPNPAKTELNLSMNHVSSKNVKVECYDILGKQYFSISLTNENAIDIHELNPGVYYLRVNDGDFVYSSMFIKE
jgi:hypothetical protein